MGARFLTVGLSCLRITLKQAFAAMPVTAGQYWAGFRPWPHPNVKETGGVLSAHSIPSFSDLVS